MVEKLPFFSESTPTLRIGDLGAILSLLAAGAVCGSIVFDAGFLTSLGLTFGSVPMTLADHTESAIQWLPITVLIGFVAFAWEAIGLWFGGGLRYEQLIPGNTRVERASRWIWRFWRFLMSWGYSIFCFAIFFLAGEIAIAFFAGTCAGLWMLLAYRVVSSPIPGGQMSWVWRRAFYYLPALSIALFGLGWDTGLRRAGVTFVNHDRALIRVDGATPRPVQPIRVFEKGVLYRDEDKIAFVEWDSVETLSYSMRNDVWRGNLCNLVTCSTRQGATTTTSAPR